MKKKEEKKQRALKKAKFPFKKHWKGNKVEKSTEKSRNKAKYTSNNTEDNIEAVICLQKHWEKAKFAFKTVLTAGLPWITLKSTEKRKKSKNLLQKNDFAASLSCYNTFIVFPAAMLPGPIWNTKISMRTKRRELLREIFWGEKTPLIRPKIKNFLPFASIQLAASKFPFVLSLYHRKAPRAHQYTVAFQPKQNNVPSTTIFQAIAAVQEPQ